LIFTQSVDLRVDAARRSACATLGNHKDIQKCNCFPSCCLERELEWGLRAGDGTLWPRGN
jgi:hypothetical protein